MLRELEAAVRAWFIRAASPPSGLWRDHGPSPWTLIFDSETLTDISLRLRVLAYQIRLEGALVETGLAYDPGALSLAELEALQAYAARTGLYLRTVREFVVDVFERVAVDLRGTVVGHNLPFDISRIASGHGRIVSGRGFDGRLDRSMLGGVSFALPGTDTRIQVKRTTARDAFIRLALGAGSSPEKRNRERGGDAADHRGYWVDTGTIGGALLGRKLKLGTLADLLGTEHRKTSVELAGPVDAALLDYACNDVQVTWECFVALRDRYAAFGLSQTRLHRIHSEASIAKAIVREMGVAPWRQVQPAFPDALTAAVMEAYYGGRVECGVRSMAVPGILVDFASQYATASTLLQMWPFHVATGIETKEEDPAAIQAWLERLTVDDVLDPSTWTALHVLVEVDPCGARLPTRAQFAGRTHHSGERSVRQRNVALVDRSDHTTQWWTLADAAAAVLETDRAPTILRAIRFRPTGLQEGLHPVDLHGDTAYRVDPSTDDVIRRLVELRTSRRVEAKAARAAGDERLARDLEARAGALKKSANSLAYGVPIEVNITDFAKAIPTTVVRPDGSRYQAVNVHRSEEPGMWFHPLIATVVVSGGRLLLAAAIRLVRDAGGTYAFCDTDSLFVVATEEGGPVAPLGLAGHAGAPAVPALSRSTVRRIVDRFEALNRYDRAIVTGSILNIVPVNFDPETGSERELWCFAIAAKRYALFTRESDGSPRIASDDKDAYRSEHGLGHLLPPLDRRAGTPPEDWVSAWWEYLLRLELDLPADRPTWFDQPAVSPLAITSAQDERAFATYNAGRPYSSQVRPWGFGMIAHVHPLARTAGVPRVLVSAREDDPTKWGDLWWFDRSDPTARRYRIRTGDPAWLLRDTLTVQSYGDYFDAFRRHAEAKAAGPEGEPCSIWTRGQLRPLVVEVTST